MSRSPLVHTPSPSRPPLQDPFFPHSQHTHTDKPAESCGGTPRDTEPGDKLPPPTLGTHGCRDIPPQDTQHLHSHPPPQCFLVGSICLCRVAQGCFLPGVSRGFWLEAPSTPGSGEGMGTGLLCGLGLTDSERGQADGTRASGTAAWGPAPRQCGRWALACGQQEPGLTPTQPWLCSAAVFACRSPSGKGAFTTPPCELNVVWAEGPAGSSIRK